MHTSCGDIDTTSNPSFYVIGKGWVTAGELEAGDEIYRLDGSTSVVMSLELERLAEPVKVYNLEIEDYHTYFVGGVSVLVHNYKKVIILQVGHMVMLVQMDIDDIRLKFGNKYDTSIQEMKDYTNTLFPQKI